MIFIQNMPKKTTFLMTHVKNLRNFHYFSIPLKFIRAKVDGETTTQSAFKRLQFQLT